MSSHLIPGNLYKVITNSCWACYKHVPTTYFLELPYLPKNAVVMYTGKIVEQGNRYYEFLYGTRIVYIVSKYDLSNINRLHDLRVL